MGFVVPGSCRDFDFVAVRSIRHNESLVHRAVLAAVLRNHLVDHTAVLVVEAAGEEEVVSSVLLASASLRHVSRARMRRDLWRIRELCRSLLDQVH
jgi:hypothetical protein